MWTAPETDELVTTETWQPPESDAVVSATAEPPAAPEGDQLHQFEPPGLASRALEAARQYLSPILGRTELQRLNEGPRDAEGLLPAASKPIIPLPKYEHQPGDGKLVGLGKAIGNTALGFAEFIESPLGIATGGVGSAVPKAMRATAGRVIAGGFAADLGSKLPEAIGTTRQTLNNPNAPFGQKAEAVLGTTAQGLIVARTGYHAARGRSVNAEAATLEREVTAGATKTEWTPPARDVVLAEAATDAGLNEAPAAIASGGSPVERFIYEAKAKAQNEALDATQRAPAAVMVEPKPWEMDYGQGGEMPRTPAVGGELPNEKTQNQGQTREVLTPPATLEPTELAPNTESKNVPAAAMDANPVTEAKPAPPEQSNLTPPEVSTTGRGAAEAAPASSPGKSKKTSPTITGSNAQTGAETPAAAVEKVQEHVAEVASGDKAVKLPPRMTAKGNAQPKTGPRPAKEIKSELVQRLEAEIAKLPPAPELLYTDPKKVQGKREFYVVAKEGGQRLRVREGGNALGWTIETEKLSGKTGLLERKVIVSATGDVRSATRTAESAMEKLLSGAQPKITIDIPGDGKFTIERTHSALNEVLRRAEALDTRSGTQPKKSGPPGEPPSPDTRAMRAYGKRVIDEAQTILDGINAGKFPGDVKAIDWVRSLGGQRPSWATIIEDMTRIGDKHNFTLRQAALDYQQRGHNAIRHAEQWDTINKPVESGTLEGWADKVLAQDPRKRTRMGLDPAEEAVRLAAVAIKGSYLIARGVRDFSQWTVEIIKQIPELAAKTETELRRLYAQAVDIAEGRDPNIGLSVRGMKVKADTDLSAEVRQNVEAAYRKRTSPDDTAEAQRLITAAGGPEAAARDMLSGLWKPADLPVQVKGAGELISRLAKLEELAGENTSRAQDLADLQVQIAEHSRGMATTSAQWLQSFQSLYGNYSPAAWLKEWRNGIDHARHDRIERVTGQKVGETPTEMAEGIAGAVADEVRVDAPMTAEVIDAVFGTNKGKGGSSGASPHQGKAETAVQAVERILGQKGEQAQKTAKKIQDFYEREVNKFKRKHKIPELSPEDQRNILAEAKAIARLPADSLQRREAVLRLLDQLHRRKGFEWWELPISFWYAHTLSGPTTHAKNIIGNSVNLGMEAGLQSMLKPTNIPLILESLGRSLSVGGKEAWSILKTGHDTSARHGDKFELRRNVIELQNGTLDKVLLPWKLVGRFLRAEDAVFFNAGQELRAAILSKRANGENTATARQAMGWTPEARTKAEAQATKEGLTGLNFQRRVNEIIEQGRPGEIMNPARDFGYDVTFNNEPYGVLGAFTSAINRGFDAAPVLKPFILPFTRIVANVSNSSLNWTPVGSYRALRAQRKLAFIGRAENSGKLYGREINDPLAIRDAHARALVGTAAMIGVTAAAMQYVFDDKPALMVTGSGPANPDQRKALQAAGWIPNSVQIGDRYFSYADKPPQVALAMVGHYMDAVRYKNLDREDALNRLTYALNGSFGVLLQSSWLQGLSSLFNQANRDSTKGTAQGLMAQGIKTGSGFVVPAALRQLDQLFDPKRYSPEDIQGMLMAQIPWARRNGQPDLNAFGQPVSSPTSKIFYSKVEGDALVQRLAGQRVFPGVPAVGDLLPDEHYALVKYRGPILRELLAEHSDEWAGAPRLIAQDVVNRISSQATAQAKQDLGLDEANADRREARKLKTR